MAATGARKYPPGYWRKILNVTMELVKRLGEGPAVCSIKSDPISTTPAVPIMRADGTITHGPNVLFKLDAA